MMPSHSGGRKVPRSTSGSEDSSIVSGRQMQKAVTGGAFNITKAGTLTVKAMEGLRELEASWAGLTGGVS